MLCKLKCLLVHLLVLSLDPAIGAIAVGNDVVCKPSEIAPATSSLLARLLGEYADESAIRVVEGAVAETSALLEQKWDKIFFFRCLYITGGARVGRIVMNAVAKHLTPVTLELGGKCPAVVDSNVNLQVTARRIIAGKWACNNGQACIGVDYIITTKEFAPKLVEKLEDSFDMINRKPKPLAAYLFSDDEQIKKKFVQNVSARGIAINDTVLQFPVYLLEESGRAEWVHTTVNSLLMLLAIRRQFYTEVSPEMLILVCIQDEPLLVINKK
ncbi:hypothetical protein CRYUN_Cryun15aG0065700 [Craigia yunnanensis]